MALTEMREECVGVLLDHFVEQCLLGAVARVAPLRCEILALERGDASVVVPIANLSFIVALALSVAMKMERVTINKVAATIYAGLSIFLLSRVS